jgi:hypothetical protein
VQQSFGPPKKDQALTEERCLYYVRGPIGMDFEFDRASGRLLTWTVYLND